MESFIDEDTILMERWREGDERALRSLVRRHEQKIFAFSLYAAGCDPDKAYAISVSSFSQAIRSFPSRRGKASFLRTLLRSAVDAAREVHSIVPSEKTESAGPGAVKQEMRKIVKRALLGLAFDAKVLLLLRDQLNFTFEVIAAVLEMSESDAKIMLAQARKQLRQKIEDIMTNPGVL